MLLVLMHVETSRAPIENKSKFQTESWSATLHILRHSFSMHRIIFFFHLEEQRALEINLGGERLENKPVILFSEEVLRVENRNHTPTF